LIFEKEIIPAFKLTEFWRTRYVRRELDGKENPTADETVITLMSADRKEAIGNWQLANGN
jgi:hypothetical protein